MADSEGSSILRRKGGSEREREGEREEGKEGGREPPRGGSREKDERSLGGVEGVSPKELLPFHNGGSRQEHLAISLATEHRCVQWAHNCT